MKITNYDFFDKLTKLSFVTNILLFGSRAREDNQERADIDIAITCPNASSADWLKVLDIIDNADTLLKIDCIRFDELGENSNLRKSIIDEGIKLYER